MVDKEMAATSAAIEEAVRRIDVSLKHTSLSRFLISTARLAVFTSMFDKSLKRAFGKCL